VCKEITLALLFIADFHPLKCDGEGDIKEFAR
jgi:hypothetical protein